MRHQSNDVAVLAAESRDVVDRSVRVGLRGDGAFGSRIAEDHLTILLEPLHDSGLGVVVPFAVRDWNPKQLARTTGRRERRIRVFHLDDDVLALELHAAVAEHRTRQQTRFQQHLEPVADAEDGAAAVGEAFHLGHDRREARDGAGSQVIAVGEPAWQDDRVGALQAGLLVPDEHGVLAEHVPGGVIGVVIAVRSREDNDGEFHLTAPTGAEAPALRVSESTSMR